MSSIDEKRPVSQVGQEKTITAVSVPSDNESGLKADDVSSTEGDDALKLAGTEAQHFSEEYYKRLRWKIVRSANRTHQPVRTLIFSSARIST